MKNILALIGLVVVLVVGFGWYLEWYKIGSTPTPDGHRTIEINAKKILEDEQKAQKKVTDAIQGDPKSAPPTGGTITPVPTVPGQNKQGDVQTTGFQFNPDGSISILPPYKNIGQ